MKKIKNLERSGFRSRYTVFDLLRGMVSVHSDFPYEKKKFWKIRGKLRARRIFEISNPRKRHTFKKCTKTCPSDDAAWSVLSRGHITTAAASQAFQVTLHAETMASHVAYYCYYDDVEDEEDEEEKDEDGDDDDAAQRGPKSIFRWSKIRFFFFSKAGHNLHYG